MVDAFAASLGAKMSAAFPKAVVRYDGENLSLSFGVSDDNFAHVLVDFTCLDEDDKGTVAVHARPDYVFEPHWQEVDINNTITRTLITADGTRFEGGDGSDGHEYPDGLGDTVWMLDISRDEELIASLAVGLAALCAVAFE
jgi:hypothetical protein